MLNKSLSIIILAAGRGNRMFSSLPKVLHPIAGKPMVQHVIDTATELKSTCIHLVYGYGGDTLRKQLIQREVPLNWVLQTEQLGTGHAVQQTLTYLYDEEEVLIIYGDIPLISSKTLRRLLASYPKGGIGILTVMLKNPNGYGRIMRLNGEIVGIVEQQDASKKQKQIKEINTGIMVARAKDIKRWLTKLNNKNNQGEIQLTDIIAIAYREGCKINSVHPYRHTEVEGVNNRLQLMRLDRFFQKNQAKRLLLAGVMLSDPERFDLRGKLHHGIDIFIDTNVILEGKVTLGNRVTIGTGCILKNVVIGDDVIIRSYTILEEANIASHSTLGPFAHLRPGSKLDEGAHVGNFVEMKQTYLGKNSKASHLSYLGDAEIGAQVNIGAGTITCNYDGANKHKTYINDNVFVGSDSQLIAPVTIGHGATIGAGTTVTNNVAEGEMIISRIRQFSIPNWVRPGKKK